MARNIILNEKLPRCIITGVDSLLSAALCRHTRDDTDCSPRRTPTALFLRSGSAVLLGPVGNSKAAELRCVAIGFGTERVTIDSEEPRAAMVSSRRFATSMRRRRHARRCGLPLHRLQR
jgi:hypothetical protein